MIVTTEQENQSILKLIKPLNQEGRARAYRAAKEALKHHIGARPELRDFANANQSDFPKWFITLIYAGCIALLAFGFVPSAIRLYDIGSITFAKAIADANSKVAVGIATVFIAEIGQILFVLAFNTLNGRASKLAKFFLLGLAFASSAVAIVGNLQVVEPWSTASAFAWIEALIPPLLVLGTAYVLKEQMLTAIHERHANRLAFENATAEWDLIMLDAEKHSEWIRFYAIAIIEQIRKENRAKDMQLLIANLAPEQKHLLFMREQKSDMWYGEAIEQKQITPPVIEVANAPQQVQILHNVQQSQLAKQLQSGGGGGTSTGEVDNALMEVIGGLYVATCPHCKKQTEGKQTAMQAKRALAAHMKAHKASAVPLALAS